MKQYVLEIVIQKWRILSVITTLLLLNIALGVYTAQFQTPSLAGMQTKWSGLRSQMAGKGPQDVTSLYKQGTVDLEKLKTIIPEKREFARVLSELYEAAASSDVEVVTISYKPAPLKEEALLSYQLTLSVSGSYASVKSYLADLQTNRELLVVDSVAFSNSDLFTENVVMDLRITIYLREGA